MISQESEKSPGPDAAGDEPCLIAARLPKIPVVVGADRVAAGRHAAARLRPDSFILDDGFQHLRLHRDLNLLVIDSQNPFGNGRVLPAGMLREPVRALRRADAVLLTHLDDPSGALELIRFIRRHRADLPVLTSRHRLTEMTELSTGRRSGLEQFRRRRVMAVTGIGRPENFFRMLQEAGMTVATACVYSDHHRFSREDLKFWEEEARRLENPVIVTTEKDAVRMRALGGPLENIRAVRMELVLDEPQAFEALLKGVFR